MAGNLVAAPPSRTELIVWSSEIFSHKANVTSLCFLSLSLCNSLRRHPIFLARVFARVFKFRRFIYFLPLPARKRGMLGCAACILYAFPYRFSLLLFHLSLSLSLLLFSDDESFKNRKGWDGRGQWGEIPEAEVFPAVSIRLMHLFPGSAARQRKKCRDGGDRFECCTMYGFCFGKDIKKKKHKKLRLPVGGRAKWKMSCLVTFKLLVFWGFFFSVGLLSNC